VLDFNRRLEIYKIISYTNLIQSKISQQNQARGRFGGRSRGLDLVVKEMVVVEGNVMAGAMLEDSRVRRSVARMPSVLVTKTILCSIFIYPNRVKTVKFVNTQRNLCDYVVTRYPDVSKIF